MASKASLLAQALLYKFRYILGYGLLIVLLLIIVSLDIEKLPAGLSAAEMQQAVASSALRFSLDFNWVINIPYNALQYLAVDAFGLSRLTLLIPSLFFGSLTIVLFTLTMRHWFRDSVAVVVTAIVVTSVAVISMIRSATPNIMLSFWTILLLYAAMRLLIKRERAFFWKILVVFASLGLLYTPYGIYPLVAIMGSAVFHPHVRSRIRHIKRIRLIFLATLFTVGLTPLVLYLVFHPNAINQLLGLDLITQSVSHPRQTVEQVFDLYFNFTKNGFSGTQIVPMFNVATLFLMILGFIRTVKDRYTARSYSLLTWVLMTAVLVCLMPGQISFVVLPAAILLAIGIETLALEWYSLFPRNPYARLAGLIPLSILFLGIAGGNIAHYFNNYRYISNSFYNQTLPAVKQSLLIEGNHPVTLVVPANETAFYSILKKEYPRLSVVTTPPPAVSEPILLMPFTQTSYDTPSRILTSATKDNSVLLRVYRPQ